MAADRPLWLKVVLRLERAVGEPVESVVRSDTYFNVVAEVSRVRRKAVQGVEGVSKRGLHLLNIPAGTDVRKVREQLARMERRLDQLSENVEDLDVKPPRRPLD
jgi:hypothetical protein